MKREKTEEEAGLFEAVCVECGKKTYVPFKPDGVRPIFCKIHRRQSQPTVEQLPYIPKINYPKNSQGPKTISLKDLESKKREGPKMDELREILNEALKDKGQEEENKKIIRPGGKIKF
jgi:CxxC-x17-CxxC domain-containing protein